MHGSINQSSILWYLRNANLYFQLCTVRNIQNQTLQCQHILCFLNKLLPCTNILTWLSKWTVQLFRFKLKYIRRTRPNCWKWESRRSRSIILSGISQPYRFLRSRTADAGDEWPLFSGESVQHAEHNHLSNNAPCEWEWSHSQPVIFNRNFHNAELTITPKA